MKYPVLVTCLLAAHFSFSQAFTIKELVDDSTGFRFPVFQSAPHPEAAKKINTLIQQEWTIDPNSKTPLAGYEEGDFGYEIHANSDRILGMTIESSYSGCGLHINRTDYMFDPQTGSRIDMNKLFGADGMAKLKKSLFKTWKVKCKAAADDNDESRADEYKACVEQAEADKKTDLDFNRVVITNTGVRFWAGSCLEGTAYDFEADRTHGPHEYSLGQLLPVLTPYGFSLFVKTLPGPFQTLLRGTIDGKYPISLTLKQGALSDIDGVIVYDRIGEPIKISGTLMGAPMVLHELDAANNALSNIEVTWDGTKLTGTFTNLKSKKQMVFLAEPAK
jgi:hypothetical protein